jgi:pyridoxamine 5'-phosphate oxidase
MQLDPNLATDPLTLFDHWLSQAAETEPNDPNAAALATATPTGTPSVRMVLVKRVREEGENDQDHRFCVFTNTQSRKGLELTQNPQAALCFHWKSLRRQVRVTGPVSPLPAALSDAYFHSRSRASQIGANVSQQSRPLASRELLEDQVHQFTQSLPDPATSQIPRPDYWQGFQLTPITIEFWQDGPARLHDRFLFTQINGEWQKSRLYP